MVQAEERSTLSPLSHDSDLLASAPMHSVPQDTIRNSVEMEHKTRISQPSSCLLPLSLCSPHGSPQACKMGLMLLKACCRNPLVPLGRNWSATCRRNCWVPLKAAAYPPTAEGAALRPALPAEALPLLPAEYLLRSDASATCSRCVAGSKADFNGSITVRDALSACTTHVHILSEKLPALLLSYVMKCRKTKHLTCTRKVQLPLLHAYL